MGGQTIRTSTTKAEALQLQSSAKGVVIPWVRGVTRIPVNLAWYGGFKSTPHTQTQGGKGGGGAKTKSTTFTYSASMYLGLGHGPFYDAPRIWVGKSIYGGAAVGSAASGTFIGNAAENYAVPGSGGMVYTTTQSANFLGLLQVTSASGSMLVEGVDFSRAGGVITVLNAALRSTTISISYQYATGTFSRAGLVKLGLSWRQGEIGQSAWSGFSSFPSQSLGYSGLAAVAGQDYELGESAQVENHNFEVVAPMAYHLGSTIPDVDPALFLKELLLDQRAGAAFPSQYMGTLQRWSDYCVAAGLLISPALTTQTTAADVIKTAADLTCSAISTSSGKLEIIPRADAAESGNGRTYTPNLTPVYDLNDECYTPSGSGESPVKYRLKGSSTRYNVWSLDFKNRYNDYAPDTADAKDAADIAARGARANPSSVNADWIVDATAAAKAVQLMMQRSISVLTEYEVPLGPHFSLIDLVDPLTLTDASLGMDRVPVLVIGIDEDEQGNLKLLCEDYPIGAAGAAAYSAPDGLGFQADYNASPGNVDTPVIFQAPAQLAGETGLEVYIAARGAGANWGGCEVWISLDGSNYRQIATLNGPSRYGALSAAMTDTATSMSVDGLGSSQLISGSATDAAKFSTLCYVAGSRSEYLAYQGATLTGAGAYTLSGLVRGAYGTPRTAHADNAQFVRIDEGIAKSGMLDLTMIGQTLYVKLPSFNIFGAGIQSLADVSPYTYTVGAQSAYRSSNTNLVNKQVFEDGATGYWSAPGVVAVSGQSWTAALQVNVRDTVEYYNDFAVRGGETFFCQADLLTTGSSYPLALGLSFLDAAGAVVAWTTGASLAAGNGWTRRTGSFTAPSNASFARPWLQIDGPGGSTLAACLAANLYIGRADLGATRNHIWMQATDPGTLSADGDYWYDTDDSNKAYARISGAWVSVRDAGITQALNDAAAAQDTADGKITSFYQTGAPTGASLGDLWFDTDDGKKPYRFDGTTWVLAQDGGIATALGDAADAQATADGKVQTFFATSAPTATAVGDLWFNTTDQRMYRWSGTAWTLQSTVGFGDINTQWQLFDATGVGRTNAA